MIPKSFSATAMNVAELCMSRYAAESVAYARGISHTAATIGTSVHGALEMYVIQVHIEKKMEPSLSLLLDLFKMSYMDTFGSADLDTEDYRDGVEMLEAWFKRTDFSDRTVISAEVKTSFPIKTSVGDIPFNYIWDRFDQTGENEYTVVDYKTNRWAVNPADLKKKIQARAYGLAAQIEYPNAEKIWVNFDMLRHDGPVGIVFTRADNIATWKFMKEKAEQILATPEDEVKETLNPECLFCVRKQSCKALQSNISVGGVFSIASDEEASVNQRAMMEWQMKGLKSAIAELDVVILAEAKGRDITEFESEMYELNIGVRKTRSIDPEMAANVLGEELFHKYGGRSLTMSNVDKLIKGSELDAAKKKQLRGLIFQKSGQPSVSINPKNAIDDE